MPKCPKCAKDIQTLNTEEMVWATYEMSIKDGDVAFDKPPIVGGTADENADNRHYNCPECGDEITTNYREAEAFLLGE